MKEILEILKEIRPENDFESSENYIDDGMLDSFDLISLISIIEETYGVVIDGLDIVPENFENLKAIKDLIDKSRG